MFLLSCRIKGTQAWDNFDFFFDLNQNPICPSQIFKNKFASFPSIFARISMLEHFRGDWAYAEPTFFWEISKKFFFFKIFSLVLLDRFLDGFSKFGCFIGEICILIRDFWVIFENYSWAYAETILSHAEHTRNRFHRMLSIRGTNFRACSASGKMWTFLHLQSMLSIRRTNLIAHWAYGERISSHAEHTGNWFHRMLSMRGNVKSRISRPNRIQFSKISCYRPLRP